MRFEIQKTSRSLLGGDLAEARYHNVRVLGKGSLPLDINIELGVQLLEKE